MICRPCQFTDRHQQVDQHRGDGRTDRASGRGPHDQAQDVDRERSSERIDETDEQGRQKGAADRADAADDDDHEGQDENGIAHSGVDRQNGRDHDAGKAREHRAEAEYNQKQAADVDAEGRHHRGVGRPRTHQHADPGMGHEHVEQRRDSQPGCDNDESPHRIEQPVGEPHRTREQLGHRQAERRRAPDQLHPVIDE
ncbi:MAG TPA: hypothetical protein VF212_03480, partial [Longimicrobiales bacterium]